jgi:hypothetical protein
MTSGLSTYLVPILAGHGFGMLARQMNVLFADLSL